MLATLSRRASDLGQPELSVGSVQRQIVLQAAPSLGQPSANQPLGPHWPALSASFCTQMLAIAAFAPSLAFNAALAPAVRPALAPRAAAPVAQIGFDKGMSDFQVTFSA